MQFEKASVVKSKKGSIPMGMMVDKTPPLHKVIVGVPLEKPPQPDLE